ncbi:MAG: hypothetical protein R3F20_02400 [Planctomycetota bacterium]
MDRPPAIWLQSSTATIYADRRDAPNDEATGILGGAEDGVPTPGASASTSRRAGSGGRRARAGGARLIAALLDGDESRPRRRFDVLLVSSGGLGGTSWHWRQYVSWIHDADFVRAIR